MLLREHRFKFFVGAREYVFRVDELITGVTSWPDRCRLQLPASACTEAKIFYGASCEEVAEKAAGFMASRSGQLGKDTAMHSSQAPPTSPRPAPRPLQLQVSEND